MTNKQVGIFIAAAFVLSLGLSVNSANAEAPNILVGRNMTVGATQGDVVMLQALLSEMGYLNVPAGIPLGYFGNMTKNALARYQSTLNVYPSNGYFGPETKTAMWEQFKARGWLTVLNWYN